MEIQKDNFIMALSIAINSRRKYEHRLGYALDSALVAGWRQLLDAVKDEQVTTVYLSAAAEQGLAGEEE